MRNRRQLAGYTAAVSSAGLGLAHAIVYTVGLATEADATMSQYLVGGLLPSALAIGLAIVALVLTRSPRVSTSRRVLLGLAWLACGLLCVQAVALLLSADPRLFAPDRPGLYSLLAGPAFGWLAWDSRQKTAATSSEPTGGHDQQS